MKTNKKLSLENLNVKSFVTNLNEQEAKTVQGGGITWQLPCSLDCRHTHQVNGGANTDPYGTIIDSAVSC